MNPHQTVHHTRIILDYYYYYYQSLDFYINKKFENYNSY